MKVGERPRGKTAKFVHPTCEKKPANFANRAQGKIAKFVNRQNENTAKFAIQLYKKSRNSPVGRGKNIIKFVNRSRKNPQQNLSIDRVKNSCDFRQSVARKSRKIRQSVEGKNCKIHQSVAGKICEICQYIVGKKWKIF